MNHKVLGLFIILAVLAGTGAYWYVKSENKKLAQIETCNTEQSKVERASLSLGRANETLEMARTRLRELNPKLLSENNLRMMKEYQRNLDLEDRYGSLANAVWGAREAVETWFSLNLTREPFDSIPVRSYKGARDLFLSRLHEAGYPSELSKRQALARELQAFSSDEIGRAPGASSIVNVAVLPSVEPQAMDQLWDLLLQAKRKAIFQRDDLTRYSFGMSLQGQPDLPEKIREYEVKLGIVLEAQPGLETAVDQAQAAFWEAEAELEKLKSDFRRFECSSILVD